MRQLRMTKTAAIIGLGALTMLASPGFAAGSHDAAKASGPVQLAHMGQSESGQGSDQPCSTGNMSLGMMGPGTMGPGMMGPGMMGRRQVIPSQDLSADAVRHFLEHRLEMQGNKRLKLGEVAEMDDDKIVAEITTVDGSLVQRLEVDRHNGRMQQVE